MSSKLRLPKLELQSFDGNMMNWMEFWDSFERNIHLNSSLCDVDKMSYLKASLKGTASHAIEICELLGTIMRLQLTF